MRNLVAMKTMVGLPDRRRVAACSGPGRQRRRRRRQCRRPKPTARPATRPPPTKRPRPADGNETAAPDGNAAAESAAAAYRASGTEPFWSLTMTDAQMVYDCGRRPGRHGGDAPTRRAGAPATLFPTPQLTVFVSAFRRLRGRRRARRANTVRVTIGGQTVTGCGSGTLPDLNGRLDQRLACPGKRHDLDLARNIPCIGVSGNWAEECVADPVSAPTFAQMFSPTKSPFHGAEPGRARSVIAATFTRPLADYGSGLIADRAGRVTFASPLSFRPK